MTDIKWTAFAALSHAAASVVSVVIERRKPPGNDPGLHERVAVLEKRV